MTKTAPSLRDRLLEPAPVYAFVYWRTVLVVWTFCFAIPRLPYLEELYTPAPIMDRAEILTLLHVPVLPIWAVGTMFVGLLFAAFAFAVGWHARVMHVIVVVLLTYILGFDRFAIRGFGELAYLEWIWLFFMPYDRLWDERGRVVKAPMWSLYLVWVQITIVYLCTFWGKYASPSHMWTSGEAMYWITRTKQYSVVFLTDWVSLPMSIAKPMTWTVLAMELAVPLMIWHRRTRPLAMLQMIAIHLGAGLTVRVTILFQFLILFHVPLFLSQKSWERLFRGLGIVNANGERAKP